MDKKVVLITGCSSGIGLSLAVRLASNPDKTFKGTADQSWSFLVCLCLFKKMHWVRMYMILWIQCVFLTHSNKCYFCLVYATMRNLAKKERLLESVKGLHRDTLDILQMDVTGWQSILDARDRVVEKRVDILGMLLCQCSLIRTVVCVC